MDEAERRVKPSHPRAKTFITSSADFTVTHVCPMRSPPPNLRFWPFWMSSAIKSST